MSGGERPDAIIVGAGASCLMAAERLAGAGLAGDGLGAIDRAISTAGGVAWSESDDTLMLRRQRAHAPGALPERIRAVHHQDDTAADRAGYSIVRARRRQL